MRQVLKINPDNADALNFIGYTHAEMGINLNEALELITKALELSPNDVLQACHDVAADVLGPDRAALYQAVVLDDGLAGHCFHVGDDHFHEVPPGPGDPVVHFSQANCMFYGFEYPGVNLLSREEGWDSPVLSRCQIVFLKRSSIVHTLFSSKRGEFRFLHEQKK